MHLFLYVHLLHSVCVQDTTVSLYQRARDISCSHNNSSRKQRLREVNTLSEPHS
jgi:hypothetical protein